MEGKKTMSTQFAGKVAPRYRWANSGDRSGRQHSPLRKEGARVVFTGRDQSTLDKGGSTSSARMSSLYEVIRESVSDGIKLTALLQGRGRDARTPVVYQWQAWAQARVVRSGRRRDVGCDLQHQRERSIFPDQGADTTPETREPAIVLNGSINAHIGMLNTSGVCCQQGPH